MSFVPAPTYAQLKDDSVALPGMPGPNQMIDDPDPLFSARALQAAAIIRLSGSVIPTGHHPVPAFRGDQTVMARLLVAAAAAAL